MLAQLMLSRHEMFKWTAHYIILCNCKVKYLVYFFKMPWYLQLGSHMKECKGSAAEHVLYFNCQRKYYNWSASANIYSVALAYNGISILIFLRHLI